MKVNLEFMQKLFAAALAAAFVVHLPWALAQESKLPQEPIRFGAMLLLTDEFAMQAAAFREGIELGEDDINKNGGINGRPVKFFVEDTQYKPSMTNSAARKLLEVDHVAAGLITSLHEAKTAGPLFQAQGVPLIVLWDSSPELTEIGNNIFGIGTWAPSSGERTAEFSITNLKAKRAVIINSNTEWAISVSNYFAQKFKALGGQIVDTLSFNPGETEFRSFILKAKSLSPDVVYAPVDDNIPAFFKQLKAINFDKPVITSENLSDELVNEIGASNVEGIYQTQPADPDGEEFKRMISLYHAKYHRKPTFPLFSAWGFDGAKLLADAAEKGGADSKGIKDQLYKVKDYPGASGAITMRSDGSSRKAVGMYQIKSGRFIRVD